MRTKFRRPRSESFAFRLFRRIDASSEGILLSAGPRGAVITIKLPKDMCLRGSHKSQVARSLPGNCSKWAHSSLSFKYFIVIKLEISLQGMGPKIASRSADVKILLASSRKTLAVKINHLIFQFHKEYFKNLTRKALFSHQTLFIFHSCIVWSFNLPHEKGKFLNEQAFCSLAWFTVASFALSWYP